MRDGNFDIFIHLKDTKYDSKNVSQNDTHKKVFYKMRFKKCFLRWDLKNVSENETKKSTKMRLIKIIYKMIHNNETHKNDPQ